jgi:cytosine/uracil/thiamine/allantoin permease
MHINPVTQPLRITHWCAQKNRRGGYVVAMVGFSMLPWNLLKNSNRFTSYLSVYSVFLSSIAGVIVRLASISLSFPLDA